MDVLRTRVLQVVDELIQSVQNAGQAFAFLADGRELVDLVQSDRGVEGRFPDHADEGWPAVAFPLPRRARFHQAASSVLTRTAVFGLLGGLDEVEDAIAWAGLTGSRNGRVFTVDLDANGLLEAREFPGQRVEVHTMIRIRQAREPDAILMALAHRSKSRAAET